MKNIKNKKIKFATLTFAILTLASCSTAPNKDNGEYKPAPEIPKIPEDKPNPPKNDEEISPEPPVVKPPVDDDGIIHYQPDIDKPKEISGKKIKLPNENKFYLIEKYKNDDKNIKNFEIHLEESKQDQPYYADRDIEEYKANQKFNISTKDEDPNLYIDTVENFKYRYKQDINDNPSILIAELDYTDEDSDFINKYLTKNKKNYILDNLKNLDEDKKVRFPHLSMVTRAFLDKNISDYYTNDYLKDESNFDLHAMLQPDDTEKSEQVNFQGIINMSYAHKLSLHLGDQYIGPKAPFIESTNNPLLNRMVTYLSYVSNSLKYKNHIYNDQLKIMALGNEAQDMLDKTNNKYFSNYMSNFYQYLSPEMQKLARNDNIFVKEVMTRNSVENAGHKFIPKYKTVRLDPITNEYVYGEYGDFNPDKSLTSALYLRANTIGNRSTVYSSADVWHTGSSFSTPHTTRAAYEIKKKFPWMSYNQVKQTLLTTADNDNSGYLNDYTGWGVVNLESALRGPAQFNAGLIDEEKYYVGMPSRIFDNPYSQDKGTHYFYVKIPYDMTSTFSNNITGGLSGDGYNNDYRIYDTITTRDEKIVHIPYKMPKVLDSERKFYANFAEGGLRKDGEGTLILDGKQLYKSNTQVLKGTLELNNDSNSKYEIFRDGTLKINPNHKKTELSIYNDIISDGTVEFNGYIKAGDYRASMNSLTTINFDGQNKLEFNSFKTSGFLSFNISRGKALESVMAFVKSENIDISKFNIINPLLNRFILQNDQLMRIKEDTNSKTIFENASKEILRNLPSYDDNEKAFFEEYINASDTNNPGISEKVNEINAPYTRYDDYNKNKIFGLNFNGETITPKEKTFVSLMNYTGNKKILFSKLYPNIVGYNLKQNFMRLENIHSNVKNTTKSNIGINESVQYLSNNNGFNNLLVGNDLSYSDTLLNGKLFVKGLLGYSWGKGSDREDIFDNHSVYANARIEFDSSLKYELDGNFNYITGSRKFQDSDIKYAFDTKTISNTIELENRIINKSNFKLSNIANYTNTIMILGDFKEKTEDTRNMNYLKEYKDNIIVKNYLLSGLNISLDLNLNNNSKLNLSADGGVLWNINNKAQIKTKMLDVNYKESLPSEKEVGFYANLKTSYTVDKNIFTVAFGVNNLSLESYIPNNIKLNIGYNRIF